MNIRLASISDVEGIACVHLESWRTTYDGIISSSFLTNLTLEGRKINWNWTFNNLNKDEVIFVLEDSQGKIVGFINGGKNRDTELIFEAEIYAIYLLKEYQGQGFGRFLTLKFLEYLKSKEYKTLLVWVLEENPAVQFYKSLDGEYITEKDIKIGEESLIEHAYGWKDITKFF